MTKKVNTFLQYLEDKFYDKLFNAVKYFCYYNKEFVLDKANGEPYRIIDFYEEDYELDFKTVWIENKGYPFIEMDVVVDVTCVFEGVEGKHHDHDSYSSSFWLSIPCKASINKQFSDFRTGRAEQYNKSRPTKPLNGDLVPIISKDQYDLYSTEILSKFYPEAHDSPIEIDVDKLANRMGLKVLNHNISIDNNVFGQVYFSDAEATIYVDGIETKIPVQKNTIIVDDEATYLRSYGSRNMTVAHECVHSYLHRIAFEFAKLINTDVTFIQCQVDGIMKGNDEKLITDWMEIQANAISPCILMPEVSVRRYVDNLLTYIKRVDDESILSWINNVVQAVADHFGVTVYASRKRLIDLGYEFAVGAFNWIDGEYLRPYAFKKGSLKSTETFSINFEDIFSKAVDYQNGILQYIINGTLQFVENHLCVNSPTYIEHDNEGNAILTDYALTHMDECCVKFLYKSIKGFSSGSEFGLMCYLCRDCSKEIEFDLEISKNLPKSLADAHFQERHRIHTENVEKVVKDITFMEFPDMLDYLFKFLDISVKEFEIDSGLSDKTISRYLNKKNKQPQKNTVVAIIRALNVPYKIAEILIKASGISFIPNNKKDDMLLFIMQSCREQSIHDVNKMMEKLGYEPLTAEKL